MCYTNGNVGQIVNKTFTRLRYVQESVHDKFAEVLTKQMASVTPGDGFDSNTNMGPCINKAQADWAQENVDDAVEQGAKVRHLLDSDLMCWYVSGFYSGEWTCCS